MFSDPSFDLNVSLIFLGVSFLIALIVWAITKKRFLPLIVFSILGNLSFLVNVLTRSEMFISYGITWLQYFSLLIWPILNIYLIIKYFSKNEKN